MKELITTQGVRGYIDENGTAQLNLEDIARGLGIVQNKNGVEYVRWERIGGYLKSYGFSISGENQFVPENIAYLLAMKADNEIAVRFQMMLANEILPSIRKHGMYATEVTIDKMINDPDFAIGLLTKLKEEKQKRVEVEAQLEYKNEIINGLVDDVDVYTKRIVLNRVVKHKGSDYQIRYRELYKAFRESTGIDLKARTEGYNKKQLKKKDELTTIKYAERFGHIDALYKVAVKLYETDVDEILEMIRGAQ